MSFTVSLQQRIQQLKKAQEDVKRYSKHAVNLLESLVVKNEFLRAIEAATDATPPTAGDLRGTNTRSGELKQHWDTDSIKEPKISGNKVETELRNNLNYASYVNNGHRMDQHFVPGLYINEDSGLLEYNPNKDEGMVVGTKTKYVKGKFMADKGKQAYEKTVLSELDKKIRGLME